MSAKPEQLSANRRTVRRLLVVVVAMFGFGFAMVPLYDVFCEITGINGKTGRAEAESLDSSVDTSRTITVQFVGNVNSALPWEVRPVAKALKVHPGQIYETSFFARNISGEPVAGQAVPSVSPSAAAKYFKKIECFCFTQQAFEGKEERTMPIRFVLEAGLPEDISTVTLAYTFFNVDENT
jgi:cytochrome c oxidase assembly protein subunit 11